MIYIVFGVSGCGKTTIGTLLAKKLDIPFYDADAFHPKANIIKMSKGLPLNDSDRKPWLEAIGEAFSTWEKGGVLACSALKETYRALLNTYGKNIQWIYLDGSFELIQQRMEARKGHFMKSNLLQSQFDTLEIPDYGIKVSIENEPQVVVQQILKQL